MSESARVQSIDAIRRFREVFAEFSEDTRNTLASVDLETRRAREWLEHEMPRYWKGQIQLWDRKQAEARSALHRKNLQRTDGYIPDVTQEKESLRIAKQRLEEAQKKLESIRRWVPELMHALTEYRGRVAGLQEAVGGESERSLHLLSRMIEALEGYVSTSPPKAGEVGGSESLGVGASVGWGGMDPEEPTSLAWLDQGEGVEARPVDEEPPTEFEVQVPPPRP